MYKRQAIEQGLDQINAQGYLTVTKPAPDEMPQLQTTITHNASNISFYDFMQEIFDELDVIDLFRPTLLEITRAVIGDRFDYKTAKALVAFNYSKMHGE